MTFQVAFFDQGGLHHSLLVQDVCAGVGKPRTSIDSVSVNGAAVFIGQ